MEKIKIGLLGVGYLGKIHLKCILGLPIYELIGFYDTNEVVAKNISQEYGIPYFSDIDELIHKADVVDIVTPTITHAILAEKVIKAGKHFFIEKPLSNTLQEAEHILALTEKYGVKGQVGHVERFNPAILAFEEGSLRPMFIEAHRLAPFNLRGTDVSVVLDVMIHDIDILLSLVDSPVKEIRANGVSIVSATPDIVNARIEFENGCVANLTASRLSMKQMRKIRIFQSDAYISLDFLEKKAEIIQLHDSPKDPENAMEIQTLKGKKYLTTSLPDIPSVNAIQKELSTFAHAILNDTEPIVTIREGFEAIKLANLIEEAVQANDQLSSTNF
jgi:predicted dehydrogenase